METEQQYNATAYAPPELRNQSWFKRFKFCVSRIGFFNTLELKNFKSKFSQDNGWCVVNTKISASYSKSDLERYKLLREAFTSAEQLLCAQILYDLDYYDKTDNESS
jgi:hypothetical protein